MTESVTVPTVPPGPTAAPSRIAALDVIRGVAVAGILFVNAPPLWSMEGGIVEGAVNPVRFGLDLAVQQRFFPIFSLLFGVGFALMFASAQGRSASPRVVMLRRLLFLLAVGAGHQMLQPGEALLPYAVTGLVVLLPLTFLTPWRAVDAVLLAAGMSGVVATAALGGGTGLIPPLLLLGYALARLDLVKRFTESPRAALIGLAGSLVIAAPLLWWQLQDPVTAGFNASSAFAGVAVAAGYVCLVMLALHTPARGWLTGIFAPLGRTAFSSYILTTLLLLACLKVPVGGQTVVQLLGIDAGTTESWLVMLGLCALILTVQVALVRAWLSVFRQGPLEWVWRTVSWGRPAAMLR